MARSSAGNAIIRSVKRIRIIAIQPRKKPATMPTSAPIVTAMPFATMPIDQRCARAEDQAGEEIAAEKIGAEPVLFAGRQRRAFQRSDRRRTARSGRTARQAAPPAPGRRQGRSRETRTGRSGCAGDARPHPRCAAVRPASRGWHLEAARRSFGECDRRTMTGDLRQPDAIVQSLRVAGPRAVHKGRGAERSDTD